MTVRVTDADWLLEILSDGKPHSHAELIRRSEAERGHGLTIHSRAADLRKHGHDVQVTTWRPNGRVHSSYQLVSPVEPQSPLSSPDGTPAVCGSTGQTNVPVSGDELPGGVFLRRFTADGSADSSSALRHRDTEQTSLFQIPASVRGAYHEAA